MEPVAEAALRVCGSVELPEGSREDVEAAFGDASLLSAEAGACAGLSAACRRALERCGGSLPPQELEHGLCELLCAVWDDAAWRHAWEVRDGGSSELAGRCPLRRILRGARAGLAYGDAASNRRYFRNFGRLAVHATMLQDEGRTEAYRRAIVLNRADFEGKVVMDVGSGSGMLAFFALQTGAARVYCVEASGMAQVIRELAAANGWADRVVVVNKVLQNIGDVEVPEQVDVIVHETLGNFLFAERGIETARCPRRSRARALRGFAVLVLLARQRFLRPGGKLFPAFATLCLAPFEDAHIYQARRIKASNLWADTDFFGVDLSSQEGRARSELFARPLSDQFHPDQLRADASTQAFDFRTLLPEELQDFSVGLACRAKSTCVVHGVAGWFEAHFEGSACSVILSTSPWDCCTHWWQTRLMLEQPLAVNEGQAVSGSVAFAACEGNTYRCRLVLESGGVRREQAGMELIDTDGTHRSVKNKTVQLQSGAQVQVIDWKAMHASPTTGHVLVDDPLREAKAAALHSEAAARAAAARAAALRGRGSEPGHSTSAGAPTLGSQIRLGEEQYILVHDPELCARCVRPQVSLSHVGLLGTSFMLSPRPALPEGPCLLELAVVEGGIQQRCWLARAAALQHMRAALRGAAPAGERRPEELDERQLAAAYAAAHAAALRHSAGDAGGAAAG